MKQSNKNLILEENKLYQSNRLSFRIRKLKNSKSKLMTLKDSLMKKSEYLEQKYKMKLKHR